MSGMWRRDYGRATGAPPHERGGNRDARPTVTAPHLDSTLGEEKHRALWEQVKRWGPAGWYPGAPCAGCQGLADIQLVYSSPFASIWEYAESVRAGSPDVCAYVGAVCPICGTSCGYRPITPYRRGVIELLPVYRKGEVLVARAQCRRTLRTFSLLPHPLAPYHRYTVDSMVITLVVAWRLSDGQGKPRLEKTLDELPGDCDVTVWLLSCWVHALGQGLRGAHPVLCGWHDLSAVRSGSRLADELREVARYLGALGARGPPRIEGIEEVLLRYGSRTGRFLIGTASQDRGPRLGA
jgi:hypothetical protein